MEIVESYKREEKRADEEARYQKMYLRMVRAALDVEEILKQAMQECEEIFISEEVPEIE